jgi:hypothetical protein
MIAVEIETPIVDHQINIFSDQLPAQSRRAKVIVMFDEAEPESPHQTILASLRANPAQARGDGLPMKREELYDRAGLR